MAKVVYKWEKIPFQVDKHAKVLSKVHQGGYKLAQSMVFNAVTELLASAHGYKVKELKELSEGKEQYAIYIEGTIEQCQKHLDDLHNGKRNKDEWGKIYTKIQNNFMFKRLKPKIKVSKGDAVSTKFNKVCEGLLTFGIILEVYIDE